MHGIIIIIIIIIMCCKDSKSYQKSQFLPQESLSNVKIKEF